MTWLVLLLVVGLVGLWLRRRAMRSSVLAGLDSERPTFSLEPPARRMSSRRFEAL